MGHNAPNILPIGSPGSSFESKHQAKLNSLSFASGRLFVCFCAALSAFLGYIGSSWAPSWSLRSPLGPSWNSLWLPWAILASGAHLGALGGYLGALGRYLGALGGYLGAPWISLGFLWAVSGSIGGLQI